MKKVINGALFNTETAKLLGFIEPEGKDKQYTYYSKETLYRTKSGKYFIHGKGRKYDPSPLANRWGEKIIPLTLDEAMEWAQKNLTDEEYIMAFGEPEETQDTKIALNISVSPEFKAMLVKVREKTGQSISQIIENKFTKK